MGGRPTIYDVAREAGVAASTVSRAYARPGRVNSDTARAIFEAAERIGYRATRITGTLGAGTAKQTGAVALMVSDITNPFYGEIIKGAEEAARLAGYALLLSDSSEQGSVERDVIERTLDLVEGVVLASSRMSDSAIRTIAKQKPLVLLNRQMPDISCIVADQARGIRRAAEHLGELGHDTITYVAGPAASWPEGMRWRALREAGMELELRIRRIDPDAAPTIYTGFATAARVVEEGATAVLAYNDALAVGVIKGLTHLGVRVPQEVSVVGFDNVLLGEVVDPPLTTVTAPRRKMGEAGVGNVLALAAGAHTSGETLVLPIRLVVRGSTGACLPVDQRRRYSISPARGTTSVSGSAAKAAGSTDAGSR
ncbi:LacI family DNA-binding transcriptional regulator [Pseudonocardia sp. CA-107938]|uniref:LacI family DNA-binding transcriptional regulator n=1 Tax=Pseudonocardia sp. CA-107938 TaxID=3240021 RepID=UPI003D9096AC